MRRMMNRHSHEHDVVYTPFMLRVRQRADGSPAEAAAAVVVVPSEDQPLARAVDAWFNLRIRAEQVIAEANAMLEHRAPLFDLVDEVGTGRLAFDLWRLEGRVTFHVDEDGRRGRVVMQRSDGPFDGPVEPADRDVLEELVIEMLDTDQPIDKEM